jgi:hypothetical protein
VIEDELAAEARHDHALAGARGERLRLLADGVIAVLHGDGLLRDLDSARVLVFHALAEHLYGNAAIDIPNLRIPYENHHNALECPYCNPRRLKFED